MSERTWIIELADERSTPSWFTVSQKFGDKGTAVIEVTATEDNPYNEDRNAFISIKSSGYTRLVTVTQKKKDAIIASKDNVWLDSKAQSFGIDMRNTTDYKVIIPEIYGQWLSRQSGNGSATGRELFNVSAITGNESRTGLIVFASGDRADTVYIYQKAKGRIFLSDNVVNVSYAPTNLSIAVENTEFNVRIEGGGDWLNCYIPSVIGKTPRVDKAWFVAGLNFDANHRSAKVIFTDNNSQLSDTVTFIQRGTTELVFYPDREYTVEAGGETLTAQVSKDREYDIVVPQVFSSWLSIGTRTPAPNGQSNLLPITISPNKTNYVRHGYVLLENKDRTLSDTILIRQLCKPDDRGVLTSFYETTGGGQWKNNTNWGTDKPLDQWHGITTDAEGKVTKIELSGNNLSGKVIDYSIDLLENLEKLDLSHNRLTGVTPRIGNSKTLRYFDISYNLINSTVPEEFVNLIFYAENGAGYNKDMEKFCINDNYFYGDLPGFFSMALFGEDNKYYYDVIKQKGSGFKAKVNVGLSNFLQDVPYTDIDNRQFGLRDFCSGNVYTVLFRSRGTDQETINSLKKLNTIARSSIPNYKIRVIWDAVDTGLSTTELNNIRQANQLDITIVNTTSGQIREKFKFGEKSEFYLARKKNPTDIFKLDWIEMFNYDIQPIYDFLLPSNLYFSSDYSKDKTYRTVQLATVGKGVDIVFAGDGFADKDIANGSYDRYAEAAFDSFFSIEPLKSLRERFNCYVVYAVSRNNQIGHPSAYTPFGGRPDLGLGDLPVASYSYYTVPEYAQCPPIHDFNTTTVMIAINYSKISTGMASITPTYGVAYTTTGPDFQEYKDVMLHEMGHAYGKLLDEYASSSDPISREAVDGRTMEWELYEMGGNIDFTDDLSKIRWKHFIGIPKYSYVGAFEAALNHLKGVWRPEILSIMNAENYHYFNAPSREQIYKKTMILSGDTYSFEEFVSQDNVTPPPRSRAVQSSSSRIHLNPPMIITDKK